MPKRTCTIEGCEKTHRARGLCVTHYNRQMPKDLRHRRVKAPCVVCGTEVLRDDTDRYQHICSTLCRTILTWGHERSGREYSWAACAALRARQSGAKVIEVFDRQEIFERDDWTCYLCGGQCERDADTCDPRSATVDHEVPLSKGGDHTRANCKTACLGCNSAKADRIAMQRAA